MRRLICVAPAIFLLLFGCNNGKINTDYHSPDWSSRRIRNINPDSVKTTHTYLPVYAQIYHISEKEQKIDLAVTVSIRNTDLQDFIYLKKIDYYNTEGHLIRKYLDDPIYIKPVETLEIVINTNDNEGGTGANFIFEWQSAKKTSKPLFESVMISTREQQGIAFTCRGIDKD